LSPRAFDIFSISERSMVNQECSEVIGLAATVQNRLFGNGFRKLATEQFDDHLSV
jgi:hypothetical protein